MNQKHTFLSGCSRTRYVTRCPHGTVHLQWDRATVHFKADELFEVANFLNTAVEQLNGEAGCCGNWYHCLVRDEYGYFQMWLLGVGFHLSSDDFALMLELLATAVEVLIAEPEPVPHKQALRPMKLHWQPTLLTSLN